MRILIRHAEKKYRNGEHHENTHDPGITLQGRLSSQVLAKDLVAKYGKPFCIVCSPYLRTRETATEMASTLQNEYGYIPPIYTDNGLSEYLGNHSQSALSVTEDTKKYDPPHPESFSTFSNRIRDFNFRYELMDDPSHPLVWFITHGIVISRLCSLTQRERIIVPYLGYIIPTVTPPPPPVPPVVVKTPIRPAPGFTTAESYYNTFAAHWHRPKKRY